MHGLIHCSRSIKKKWSKVAVELNQATKSRIFRHGKQCRERWNNHLDPKMNKAAWTIKEDIVLLE